MAALGAGAGAFTGDVEREKLAQGWASIAQNQERIDLAADQQAYEQGWGNAIKQQDLANRQKEFQERSLKVDALIRAGQEEERQMASIKRLRESSLGNAIIAGEKSGGGILRQSQLNMFNSENQTAYDVAGKLNPQTGKVYEDGLWHFLQFKRDDKNRVVMDSDGSPSIAKDVPISRELYNSIMSSEFGQMYLNGSRSSYGIGGDRLAIEKLRNKNAMDLEDKRIAGKIAVQNLRNDGRSSRSSSTRDDSLQRQKAVWDAAMRYSEDNPEMSFDDALKRASSFFGYGQQQSGTPDVSFVQNDAQAPTQNAPMPTGQSGQTPSQQEPQMPKISIPNGKFGTQIEYNGQPMYYDGNGSLLSRDQYIEALKRRRDELIKKNATEKESEPSPVAPPAKAKQQDVEKSSNSYEIRMPSASEKLFSNDFLEKYKEIMGEDFNPKDRGSLKNAIALGKQYGFSGEVANADAILYNDRQRSKEEAAAKAKKAEDDAKAEKAELQKQGEREAEFDYEQRVKQIRKQAVKERWSKDKLDRALRTARRSLPDARAYFDDSGL